MPTSHGRQKQLEKQKKKREAAKRKQPARPPGMDFSPETILREAARLPMGPCYISADWRNPAPPRPPLVSVVVTGKGPGNIVVPAIALVARTCLGVKNGFVAKPMAGPDLQPFLARLGEAHE